MKERDERSLVVVLGDSERAPSVRLALTSESPWSSILGRWPLPASGSIDALADAMSWMPAHPGSVSLVGCPSACLLPLLWLRTTWLGSEAAVSIDWRDVEDPTEQWGRQAAGRLACALASSVTCADPDAARRWWGLASRDGSFTLDARPSAEAFDLLNNLIDVWGLGPKQSSMASAWAQAVRRELVACASLGLKRVALYGAGTHTRALGEVLMEPDVEIVAIIDDDTRRHGTRLWGYPIVSPDDALSMNLDAIVLSANSVEDLLWERTARHRAAGIRVSRLYGRLAEPSRVLLRAPSEGAATG